MHRISRKRKPVGNGGYAKRFIHRNYIQENGLLYIMIKNVNHNIWAERGRKVFILTQSVQIDVIDSSYENDHLLVGK